MRTTSTQHGINQKGARYTIGFKTYKTAERVKMRKVKIYRNGAWIYCDAFTEAERETHEAWAREFLKAMKLNDTRQNVEEPEEMPVQAVQQQIWENILKLREAGLMTNREAADFCLVRFTWTEEQAKARLAELEERYPQHKIETMEESTPSPEIKQPFYRLATNSCAPKSKFDLTPLLQVLTQEDTPLEMARSLDKVYTLLAEYLVSDANTYGTHYAELLSDIRRMRDALLQGSGLLDFHDTTPGKKSS